MFCLSCIPLYGLVLAGLIIVYQIYRFYIRPNNKLQQYRNQGLPVIFAPFSGYLKQVGIDLQKHGDMYYTWKQLNTLNPKPKAFASNFGDKPVVALKDPELIKQFFMAQEKNYIKAPGAVGVAKLILRNGTLLSEGAVWKAHRKLTSPIYSYDLLKERIQEYVQLADAGWERLKTKDLKKVNFLKEVQSINLEIAGKLFLDIELHKLEFKGQTVSGFVSELIDRSALEALDPFTVIFGTNIVKHGLISRQKTLVQDINDLRGFLYGAAKAKLGEVLAAKANGTSTTKLPLFLELLFEQKQKLTQEDLDEVDLVDEFANFVLGTMDTTSHSIIFASYFHLINPNSQKKLVEEVDRVFKNPSSVTLDNLNGMDYMNAVLKETLRMIPPLPNFLPREAIADHQIGNIKIDAGTIVVAAGVTNSFDPEYHDEPEVFKPERWLDENSKTRKSVSKNAYIYIPFSTGARTCPGKEIGNNLVRIVLGLFVKKFNYSLADKKYVMAFSAKLFSEPAEPLIYAVEPRN